MDLISIIMPAFNAENFISKTIQSVINQTYEKWELIIVNDGSTDNTNKICEEIVKFDKRIKLYTKKNEGVAKARNFGINRSKGKYIMFIDSDDIYEKDIIEKMYTILKNESVDIVRAGYKFLDGKNVKEDILEGKYDREKIKDIIIDAILKEKIGCYVWLLLIRRDLVITFNENLFIYEDFNFYLNVFLNCNTLYIIKEPLYLYNRGNYNSLTKKNIEANIYNIVKAEEYIRNTLIENELQQKVEIIDSRIITIIVNYIFYLQYRNNKKYAFKIYNELKKEKNYLKIIKNYNIKYISLKERIFNYSVLYDKNFLFQIICFIKTKLNKLRGKK